MRVAKAPSQGMKIDVVVNTLVINVVLMTVTVEAGRVIVVGLVMV